MPVPHGLDSFSTTPHPETDSHSSPLVAGKKRKAPTHSSRGVASLTPDQLAKKRANDREAQRAIRERTRSQIEALERKIQELTSQQPYQELQVILRQKQAIQEENDEIRRRLASVSAIIQPIIGAQGLTDLATAAHAGVNHGHQSSSGTREAQGYYSSTSSLTPEKPSPTIHSGLPRGWPQNNGHVGDPVWSPVNALEYQRNNLRHGLDLGSSGDRLGLNFLLDGQQQIERVPSMQQTVANQPSTPINIQYSRSPSPGTTVYTPDVPAWATPCRNIPATCPLDGVLLDFLHARQYEASQGVPPNRLLGPAYPSVSSLLNPESSIHSHPVSKVFTDIISKFPDISGLPEQVAVLYTMFLLMRWQIHPTQENYERLPEWFCPRPSQILHPHPAWIDYLPWPRMRDKLVECYTSYPFENFFVPFTKNLCVNWPYEPTDTLLKSPIPHPAQHINVNGKDTAGAGIGDQQQGDDVELMINPVFERHCRDLRNWSVGSLFEKVHPGLVMDGVRVKDDDRRLP